MIDITELVSDGGEHYYYVPKTKRTYVVNNGVLTQIKATFESLCSHVPIAETKEYQVEKLDDVLTRE
jgi:hypothetical protein